MATVYGIDSTDSIIRCAALAGKGDLSGALEISGLQAYRADEEELNERLSPQQKLMQQVVIGLSRNQVLLVEKQYPAASEEELQKMVSYDAIGATPLSSDEETYDYQVLREGDGRADVLTVIAPKNNIERNTGFLQVIDVIPEVITLRLFSLINLLEYLHTVSGEAPASYGVMLCSETSFELAVIEHGWLVFSRGLKGDFTGAAAVQMAFETSRDIFLSQAQDEVPELFFSAGPSESFSFAEGAGLRLASIGDMIRNSPKFTLKADAKADGANLDLFVPAIALAFEGFGYAQRRFRINLLTDAMKQQKQKRATKKSLTSFFIWAAALIALLIINVNIFFMLKERKLAGLESQLSALTAETGSLEEMREVIKLIRNQLEVNPSILDLIAETIRITPPDISLNSFHYDDSGQVIISGETPRFENPYTYVTTLENSDVYESVILDYSTRRQIGDQETFVFKISSEVTNRL